jgi:hypothetical protein
METAKFHNAQISGHGEELPGKEFSEMMGDYLYTRKFLTLDEIERIYGRDVKIKCEEQNEGVSVTAVPLISKAKELTTYKAMSRESAALEQFLESTRDFIKRHYGKFVMVDQNMLLDLMLKLNAYELERK